MPELKNVELTDFKFPCVTYILRRSGLKMSPEEFVSAPWKFKPFDESVAEIGDIVCWQNGGFQTDVTLKMSEGIPVTTSICCDYHYAIYEGNGLISDLTIDGNNYAPRIRVRGSVDARKPDFILSA